MTEYFSLSGAQANTFSVDAWPDIHRSHHPPSPLLLSQPSVPARVLTQQAVGGQPSWLVVWCRLAGFAAKSYHARRPPGALEPTLRRFEEGESLTWFHPTRLRARRLLVTRTAQKCRPLRVSSTQGQSERCAGEILEEPGVAGQKDPATPSRIGL